MMDGWLLLLPTKRTVQCLRSVPPVLDGLSAALQGQLQRGHPLLHLCLTVCSQEVAVAVLHLQLKTIATHLRTLREEFNGLLLTKMLHIHFNIFPNSSITGQTSICYELPFVLVWVNRRIDYNKLPLKDPKRNPQREPWWYQNTGKEVSMDARVATVLSELQISIN